MNVLYDALTTMVIKNLVAFSRAINQDKPLFQVDGLLSNPDVMLQPSVNDIFKLTVQSIRDAVEVCKNFCRWMEGTCIETPPKDVPGQDEPYVFTFFDDISDNPVIHELLIQVTRREMTGVLQSLQCVKKCVPCRPKFGQKILIFWPKIVQKTTKTTKFRQSDPTFWTLCRETL